MNIMHLTYDMRIGGTEQVIKNIIESSNLDEFKMSIFCLEKKIGPFGKMLQKDGIKINSIQRKDGFDLSLIKTIKQHITNNNIDIIHCHQYTPWVYGALAAFGTNKKVIFTEHGRFYPDSSSWKRKLINPFLVFITDKITAISKSTKQALVDYEFIPNNRIQLLYNGIVPLKVSTNKTSLLRKELGIKQSTQIIGTVARLDPIKNHTMMLKAFKLVLQEIPDTKLLIIGDGEERETIQNLIEKLKIEKNVILTGYISKPKYHIDCMDLFLLSSFSEGTSMTLLEAMSLSKPCIVTNAGGNPEIVKNDLNGFVTKNDDEIEFSKAIITLLKNPIRQISMQKAAKSVFINDFSAQKMATSFKKIYLSLN